MCVGCIYIYIYNILIYSHKYRSDGGEKMPPKGSVCLRFT